jgi:glycosyltransferase involved in cell wall biosynthesis
VLHRQEGSVLGVIEPQEQLRRDGVLIVEQGGRGGVADYTACLARALAERGIPVTVATAGDHRYRTVPGMRVVPVFHYVRGHSRPAALARRLRLGPVLNGLRFLWALPRLVPLARRHAITHMQGWERTSLGLAGALVLRAAAPALVYTAHNTFERRRTPFQSVTLFPALARRTIAHTQGDLERLGRDAVLIPHGHYGAIADTAPPVDPERARAELGLPADAPVALMFGVLRPDKGLEDLLIALASSPAWRAVVAGEDKGALAASAERLAALSDRVTVHAGFQEAAAMGRFFAAADVVALPYHRASQSGVLHLAYGFGRPVVAYPVGGLAEAIRPGETGWLCAEATPAALADALGEIDRTEARRRGEEARRWGAERFGWAEIAAATEVVYVDALRSTAARKSSHDAA